MYACNHVQKTLSQPFALKKSPSGMLPDLQLRLLNFTYRHELAAKPLDTNDSNANFLIPKSIFLIILLFYHAFGPS